MDAPAVEQAGHLLHLDQRQLRRGEHHHVDLVAGRRVGGIEGSKSSRPIGVGAGTARPAERIRERRRLRRHAGHVEHGHRAEARQRRAEMLELVGVGHGLEARDDRHLPVAVGGAADDAAERAPVGEVRGLDASREMHGPGAMRIEVVAVARRAAGQPGGQRRGPALEVAARAHDAVGVDDDAGVAEGQVLAAHRAAGWSGS